MKPALVIVDVQEVLIPLIWRGAELADLIADGARAQGVPVVALQQVGGALHLHAGRVVRADGVEPDAGRHGVR